MNNIRRVVTSGLETQIIILKSLLLTLFAASPVRYNSSCSLKEELLKSIKKSTWSIKIKVSSGRKSDSGRRGGIFKHS